MVLKINRSYSREYDKIREAVHYRRSTKCKPPCVVRYRSWWVEPLSNADVTDTDFTRSYDVFREKVKAENQLLAEEYQNMSEIFKNKFRHYDVVEEPPAAVLGTDGANANGFVIFSGVWLGIYSRNIISMHEERLSLTQVLDFGYHQRKLNSKDRCELDRFLEQIETDVGKDHSVYERLKDNLEALDVFSNSNKDFLQLSLASEFLTSKIWHIIDHLLFSENPNEHLGTESKVVLFADFRSILLHSTIGKQEEFIFEQKNKSEERTLLEKFWPVIAASEASSGALPRINSKDVIACSVNNNTAIYASTLGRFGNVLSENFREPIKYFIITNNDNKWTNGRIIDAFNRLGVYRISAVRNHDRLRAVGHKVQTLGAMLDGISDAIMSSTEKNSLKSDSDLLAGFFKEFQKISGNRVVDEQSVLSIDRSVQYRIYRSKVYAEAFQETMQQLDMGLIDGYFPYENFVRRQLFAIFRFTEELGKRISNLKDRYMVLVSYVQMQERVEFLRVGEIVEIVAVSYYLGNMLDKIGQPAGHYMTRIEKWDESTQSALLSFVMYAIGGLLWTLVLRKHGRKFFRSLLSYREPLRIFWSRYK